MKVFGGWLPFIGFRKYYSEELEDTDHSPEVVGYFRIRNERIVGVSLHAFEIEWFGTAAGYVYKTEYLTESA